MEIAFCKDTLRVSYDHDDDKTELQTVVLVFGGNNQVTYQGEEAQRFFRHYMNGLAVKEISGIPSPDPVEWGEKTRYKN